MKVITNSGPLIALGKLGLLDLPGQLYGQPLFLPSAVHAEVVLRGAENDHADAHVTQLAINRSYLRVISVGPRDLPPDLAALPLDAGEKEVIFVAMRDKADLVLFDDLKARDTAKSYGLAVKGTLGIIVSAYRNGLLQLHDLEAIINSIIIREDIWIARGLCRDVLAKILRESRG